MVPALLALLGQTAGAQKCSYPRSFSMVYKEIFAAVKKEVPRNQKSQRILIQRFTKDHASARIALDKSAAKVKHQIGEKGKQCLQAYEALEKKHAGAQTKLDEAVNGLVARLGTIDCNKLQSEIDKVDELFLAHRMAAKNLDEAIFPPTVPSPCKGDIIWPTDYTGLIIKHMCARYHLDESLATLIAMRDKACQGKAGRKLD